MRSGRHSYIGAPADLRERCKLQPASRPALWWTPQARECWIWGGARSCDQPRVWTWDYDRGEKRAVTGARAAWYIGRQRHVPTGTKARMQCLTRGCVNPAHVAAMPNRAWFALVVESGRLRGSAPTAVKHAALAKAHAARGIKVTPAETVRAIREAPASVTTAALAAQFGLAHSTAWNIRTGRSRAGV